MKYFIIAALAAIVCVSSSSFAQFAKLSSDGLPDSDVWADHDLWIKDTMASINASSGNPALSWNIKFEFDKPGFQTFYKKEMMQPKNNDRVGQNPQEICKSLMDYFRVDGYGAKFSQACKRDDVCAKAIGKSVKKIVCGIKYGATSETKPTVSFKNGVLHGENCRIPGNTDVVRVTNEQIAAELRKSIPEYDKYFSSHE